MKAREDYGTAADDFFKSCAALPRRWPGNSELCIRKALPDATESIKWGMPVYETEKLVCAVRPADKYVGASILRQRDRAAGPRRVA